MFNSPITFIVGAGASHEYRLPLGSNLASNIQNELQTGVLRSRPGCELLQLIDSHCLTNHVQHQPFLSAAQKLSDRLLMGDSVDEAIHYWKAIPEAVLIGKAAIASHILYAERNSTISELSDHDPAVSGWLQDFFFWAFRGLTRESLGTIFENVSFISFNYDRCIEHYLTYALKRFGHASQQEADDIIADLVIIRPYGSVGEYPRVPFGASVASISESIRTLRTFTEDRMEDDVDIQSSLSRAEKIVFLGFGYHPSNLSMLYDVQPHQSPLLFGTQKGIPIETAYPLQYAIKDRLNGSDSHFHPATASELFNVCGALMV